MQRLHWIWWRAARLAGYEVTVRPEACRIPGPLELQAAGDPEPLRSQIVELLVLFRHDA